MKTPTTYTPYYLSLSLAIVFAAMFAITNSQSKDNYVIATSENGSRVNQPGPTIKKNTTPTIIQGTPVFFKGRCT
ncbi:MAG: hypothetical protein AB8F74_15685 [Saprospiraceae bacterium]